MSGILISKRCIIGHFIVILCCPIPLSGDSNHIDFIGLISHSITYILPVINKIYVFVGGNIVIKLCLHLELATTWLINYTIEYARSLTVGTQRKSTIDLKEN